MTNETSTPSAESRPGAAVLFRAERVPVLQNLVYERPEQARGARHGALDIRFDAAEDFGWNAAFDPAIVEYSSAYDNSVPSQRFADYYDAIGDYLAATYDLARGPVVDVGCGKGTFLERLVSRHPGITGLGVDPAYEGLPSASGGRLKFIAEPFQERHIPVAPSLVLCRHTLEHIPDPTSFLRSVLAPLRSRGEPIPLFAEVPDLGWILAENAFWDFCYEHVNYFTARSFARCLSRAGTAVTRVTPAFGDQYLWAEGVVSGATKERDAFDESALPSAGCADRMAGEIKDVFRRLTELGRSHDLVVWGMATKGVMYSMHALEHGVELAHCVDVNPRKQGRYCPLTALRIDEPGALEAGDRGRRYAVICMNPNYLEEVRGQCAVLGLEADLFDAGVTAAD